MKRKLERKSSVRCFLESLNKEPTFKGERSNSFPSNDSKKFDIKAPIDGTTGHLLSLERCTKGYSLFQGLKYRQGHNFTKLTKSDKKIKLPKKNIMKSSIAKFTCQRNFAAYPIVIDGNEKKIAGNTSENLFSILSEKVQEQKSQKETIVKKLYFKDISANLSDAYHVLSVESEKPTQIDQEIAQNDNQNQRNGFLYRNKKGERKSSEIQKQKSPKHLFEPINSHFKIGNPLDIILPPPVEFSDRKLEHSVSSNIFSPTALAIADYQEANIPELNANKRLENSGSIKNKQQFKVFDNSYSLALTRACFKQNTANSAPVTFADEKLKHSVTNDIFTPPVLAVADCQVANIPEIDSNKQFEDGEPINKKERFKVVDNNCSLALTRACFKQNTANSAAVTFADEKLKHSVTNDIFTPPVLAVADCQVANIPEIDSNKQFEDGEPINKKERFKVVDNNCSLALTQACFKQNTANSAPVTFAAEKLKPSVTNAIFTPPVLAVADCQVANIPEFDSNKQFEDGESINKKEKFKVVDNNCSVALTHASIRLNTAINDSDYKIQKNNVALGFQNEECSSCLMFNCKDVFSCNELAMQKENVTLGIGSNSALDISDIQNPIQQQEVKNGDDYIALEEIHSLDQDAEKTSDSMDVQKTSHNFEDVKRCSDLAVNALTLDCNRKTVTITCGDFIHSCTGKESTDTLVLPELSCSINPFPLMYKGFAINPVSGHTLTVGTGINSLPILFKSNENDSNILPKGKSPFLKKMQDEPMSPLAMSDQMKLGNLVHEFALTLCNNDKDQSFFAAPFQSCNDADTALAEEIKFQKDSLKNSRVIAQLDSKFVCAFDDESGVIFVVDQHAAHERIKLEELFKEHIQPNGTVMHCPLNQPLILPFCEEKKKSAGTKVDLLQKCGVTLKDIAIGLEVTSVPLCFLLRKKHQTRDQLQQLVSDTIDEVLDTPLRSEFIPSTVVSALASMACHGSVRFGRKMSRDSCLQLIRLLSAQKLPFQCAHGRPSLVPLIKIPTIAKFLLSKPVKNLVARKKKFNA